MPAPTRDILYAIEDTVMSASYEILSEVGIPTINRQRDDEDHVTPRVEIQVLMGAPTGHVYLSGSKGFYDSFAGSLQAYVVTDRAINASVHNGYRNSIIHKLTDYRNFNSGSLMPYHTMVMADYGSTQVSVDNDSDYDISGITINFQIWIKRDAWPTE